MPPRKAVGQKSVAVKVKKAEADGVKPNFDIEVNGKRYKVFLKLMTWQHEAILKSETQLFEPGGFTWRKINAQLGTQEYTQLTLAALVLLARLQAGEQVTFIEVANEVGGGYDPEGVKWLHALDDDETEAPDEDDPGDSGKAQGS